MIEYLVIDAYNIINAWRDIFNPEYEPLEDSREKLLNILSNYQGYKKNNIIVVFDAHSVKGRQDKMESFDNIKIVFTKENETADSYIERLVYILSKDKQNVVRVATLDYLEQTTVLNIGGVRLTPNELRKEIEHISKVNKAKGEAKKTFKNTIDSKLDPDVIERLEKIRRGKP